MRLLLAVLLLLAGVASGPATAQAARGQAAGADSNEVPGLDVVWSPAPRWLDGVAVNRRYFGGGLDYGTRFVTSTVADRDVPPVEVVFDAGLLTTARVFDYGNGLRDLGTGTFQGAAYDVSDPARPRRLNVGFLEDPRGGTADRLWNPNGSATGAREYLLVFASDYLKGTSQYTGKTAYGLDTYYGLAARVADGHALYEQPATLALTPAPLRDVAASAIDNGQAQVSWTAAAYTGGTTVRVLDGAAVLAAVPAGAGTVMLNGLDPARRYALTVSLSGGAGVVAEATVEVQPSVSIGVAAESRLDPGRAGRSGYGDTWGYTAPDGTEYGLLAVRDGGLSVIDVTAAPAGPPVEVAFVASPPGATDAKDVKVYRHYAYLVHETGPVQILDLSDPSAPVEVGRLDVQPGVASGGAHNVVVARDHLWVVGGRTAGTSPGGAGLRVYSLADPAAPALVGTFRPDHQPVPYYHDFEVRGGRAYGSAIYSGGGVDVLDVADPAAIRHVSTFTYPGAGAHNTCATQDGRTVYVGDEIGTAGNWIRIFDASTDDPELVGEVVVDRRAAVHNCYVRGSRLYVAHYTEGLRVFDVTDPHRPVETARLDTYRQPGYGYRGAWTAYPYFASGKVIVSDMQTGLWVATLDQPVDAAAAPAPGAGLRVWPNPARGVATAAYALLAPSRVRVSLLDVLGREVAVAEDGVRPAGPHRARLDTAGLPAGLYVVRLAVDGQVQSSQPVTVVR